MHLNMFNYTHITLKFVLEKKTGFFLFSNLTKNFVNNVHLFVIVRICTQNLSYLP